jgi:sugar phosphate isomerase/epimerase/peptidoglycan/xylan/chitin deacetylase (PgdA/CDA1 family)
MAGQDEAHAGPARDFAGYGRRTPPVRWPDDASLVVNIVLNYESGAEYSLLDGDGRNDSWGEYSGQIGPHVRDLGTETHFEFGSRAGIWRLARLFDGYQVPVTIGACGLALERNPEVAEWIAGSGHDVLGHGYRWAENSELTREQERDDLRRGIDSIQRLTGERPLGWYCRSFPSVSTRSLLVEEGGFLYDSDASNDELPYFADVGGAPFLVVPYSKVYNDVRYLLSPAYSTPNDFFENLRAAVGYLCDEAAGHGARMMTVGLHERWSGQASRATAIRDFVEYVRSRPDVRFMRRLDIARWWLAHHAEWDPAPGTSAAPAARAQPAETAPRHDDRAVTGRLSEFERLLDLAQAMRAPQLRVSAPPYEGGDVGDELRRLADRLAERAGLAVSRDVRLLVGIAPGTLIPGPEWFRRAARDLRPERLGAVYDPGGMVVEGRIAPRLAIAALGRYLQHVQVKDMLPQHVNSVWGWGPARPGAGVVSWPGVLAALAAADYGGWLAIDHLSGPARPARLERDVAALRQLVAGTPARPISWARSTTGPAITGPAITGPAPSTEGDRA